MAPLFTRPLSAESVTVHALSTPPPIATVFCSVTVAIPPVGERRPLNPNVRDGSPVDVPSTLSLAETLNLPPFGATVQATLAPRSRSTTTYSSGLHPVDRSQDRASYTPATFIGIDINPFVCAQTFPGGTPTSSATAPCGVGGAVTGASPP